MNVGLSFLLKQHMLLRMNFKRTLYAENIEWETTTQTKGRRKGWDDEKNSDVPDNEICMKKTTTGNEMKIVR